MVHILGIAGSPQASSNSSIMVSTALDAAAEEGAMIKFVGLAYLNLQHCEHCNECAIKNFCSQDDDLNKIVELIKGSDGLILGSPVHHGGVSSRMKIFLDRIGRFVHLQGKVGAAFAVGRRSGIDLTLSQMIFFMLVKEMIVPGGISWPMGLALNVGDIRSDLEGMDIARQMGFRVAVLAKILHDNPIPWRFEERPPDKKSRFGDEWRWPEVG